MLLLIISQLLLIIEMYPSMKNQAFYKEARHIGKRFVMCLEKSETRVLKLQNKITLQTKHY